MLSVHQKARRGRHWSIVVTPALFLVCLSSFSSVGQAASTRTCKKVFEDTASVVEPKPRIIVRLGPDHPFYLNMIDPRTGLMKEHIRTLEKSGILRFLDGVQDPRSETHVSLAQAEP